MGEGGMPEEVRQKAQRAAHAAYIESPESLPGALRAESDAAAQVGWDAGLAAGRADERARVAEVNERLTERAAWLRSDRMYREGRAGIARADEVDYLRETLIAPLLADRGERLDD